MGEVFHLACSLNVFTLVALYTRASSSSCSTQSQPCKYRNDNGLPEVVPRSNASESFCVLVGVAMRTFTLVFACDLARWLPRACNRT